MTLAIALNLISNSPRRFFCLALTASPFNVQRPKLFVCIFLNSTALARSVQQCLSQDAPSAQEERYTVVVTLSDQAFFSLIEQQRQQLDCLILQDGPQLPALIAWLHDQATLLPIVILDAASNPSGVSDPGAQSSFLYHSAEVRLVLNKIKEIVEFVDRAIGQFLNLSFLSSAQHAF